MVYTFCMVLVWENVECFGKIAVFQGGYGQIGEIPHGQIMANWGL